MNASVVTTSRAGLPPGQRAVDGFPRFGTHLYRLPPAVPAEPAIEVGGAGLERFVLPGVDLATLPRCERIADLHCVAGWSATNLRWEGVAFDQLYRTIIEPRIPPDQAVTHLVFGGLDGYRCIVSIADALAEDVLIADSLDGRRLDGDHGAPLRLVSPSQYAYVSVKHLCRIELHTREPAENFGHASRLAQLLMLPPLFKRHPRSRVWEEERNGALPAWVVRPIYRLLIPPIKILSARPGEWKRYAARAARGHPASSPGVSTRPHRR
jgi:DMSO/TMAO reductase YedYZ molybdopterin-dependent catalytic subunit